MSYTIASVTADLQAEFAKLNRKWRKSGDVNDIEYGGVRYRKGKDWPDEIEYVYYQGLSNGVSAEENKLTGSLHLSDLIEGVKDVWNFADGKNCGFDIGGLIQSLDTYRGIIRNN